MDIYAKKGTRVKFIWPSSGYLSDQEVAAKFLEVGKTYTVDATAVGGWQTIVYLKEIQDVGFNSVMFE